MDDTPRDAEQRPHDSIPDLPLRPLSAFDPLRWLRLGWRDFMRAPGIGLFYGACFAAMGWCCWDLPQRTGLGCWRSAGFPADAGPSCAWACTTPAAGSSRATSPISAHR